MATSIIEAPEASNEQKYLNYKEQFRRLAKARAGGFNLEAIFIEYTIIEDRTESILRYAGKFEAYVKKQKGHRVTLESKLNYIKKIAEEKKSLAHKYFPDELICEILEWKDERNRLIHALLKQQLTDEDIESCASRGEELAKTLRNKTSSFNRAIERAKIKSAN